VRTRSIVVNTRVLGLRTTGARRFLQAMLCRFPSSVQMLSPPMLRGGICGHAWEQTVLPYLVGKDVLWSPTNTGPLSVARQVVTVHDVVPLDHPEWLNPSFARLHRWLVPRIIRRAAHVITVSEFTRQRVLANTGIAPEKVSVVHNGVDPVFIARSREEVERVRRNLAIPEGRYVLAVSCIEPRKNLVGLLKAWQEVVEALPEDLWLVIAGTAGRSVVYKEVSLGAVPKRVRFLGHVPDDSLPALYSGALAFAYVSKYEGFGLPVLEAMACQTPVLTGDSSAFPEVVGGAGIMVSPFDVGGIAAKIRELVEDSELRASLIQKGLERSKQFSWQAASERTLRILSEVAAA